MPETSELGKRGMVVGVAVGLKGIEVGVGVGVAPNGVGVGVGTKEGNGVEDGAELIGVSVFIAIASKYPIPPGLH